MNFDLPPGPPPSPAPAPAPSPSPAAPPATPKTAGADKPTAEGRATEFKAVDQGEMQSGEKLLVEAYAAIWLVLFVMVYLSWRRQRGIEARIAGLETAIEKARGLDGGAPQAPAKDPR